MPSKDLNTLLLDWDTEENAKRGLYPEDITVGSAARVFWKCHICGGKWSTVMKERRGCPYCCGFKALSGYNDLATKCPELLKEWDFEKNTDISPSEVTCGSQKKVYWKCGQGHSWQAQVNSRIAGRGCPFCHNRKVLKGFNDLATVDPELAAEWNCEKNGELRPEDVLAGTKREVWWKCRKCGSEWKASVSVRHRGRGCPFCSRSRVAPGKNDLKSLFPDVSKDWDYERNSLLPSEVMPHSRKKVYWICPKGHRYAAVISDRVKGNGCSICSRERRVSFPEKTVLYYLKKAYGGAEANYRAEWLGPYEIDIFLPEFNIGVEYDGIYGHSKPSGVMRDIRKNGLCAQNGITLIRIREYGCPPTDKNCVEYIMRREDTLKDAVIFAINAVRGVSGADVSLDMPDIDISRDSGEIYSLIEFSEKENSLAVKCPEIAKMWHPTKNGRMTPEHVSVMSSKKVWWRGSCGHEWASQVSYEAKSGLCPYCSGKRVLEGFNDLKSVNPALAEEWDYERNSPVTPDKVTFGSGKKVWWKCKKGHSWRASVVSRNRGNGCPICANRVALEGYNDITSIPELSGSFDRSKNKESPESICIGSEKKVWWRCEVCGHSWRARVSDRAHGSPCPECSKRERSKNVTKTYVARSGSLLENHPDIAAEWDYSKNTLRPEDVTCGSEKKVWWICPNCGESWCSSVAVRAGKAGSGCPECGKKKQSASRRQTILKRKQPLSVTHPKVSEKWDHIKNAPLTPDSVTAGSGRRVWWRCEKCGSEWQMCVCDMCKRKFSCLNCKE